LRVADVETYYLGKLLLILVIRDHIQGDLGPFGLFDAREASRWFAFASLGVEACVECLRLAVIGSDWAFALTCL